MIDAAAEYHVGTMSVADGAGFPDWDDAEIGRLTPGDYRLIALPA